MDTLFLERDPLRAIIPFLNEVYQTEHSNANSSIISFENDRHGRLAYNIK